MAVTGWKFPTNQMVWQGTAGTQGYLGDPINMFADDDNWSVFYNNDYKAGVYSAVLRTMGFDFSDIPNDATLVGIEVQINRSGYEDGNSGYGATACVDSRVSLAMHTTATVAASTTSPDIRGSNYASTDRWTVNDWLPSLAAASTTRVYGGAADTWASGLTVADIKSAAFAVDLQASGVGYKTYAHANYIKVRIHYSAPVPEFPETPPFTGTAVNRVNLASSVNVSTYNANYAVAREGTGAVSSANSWVGQYWNGTQHEVNQIVAAFDLSNLPGAITSARMILTLQESYGTTKLEVREHNWSGSGGGVFVPGSTLASKRLVGSKTVAPSTAGEISIGLDTSRPLPSRFVFCISDQTKNIPSTIDNTMYVTAVRLEVVVSKRRTRSSLRM